LTDEDGWPFSDLAHVLEDLGRKDEAEEQFLRAIEINPSQPHFHRNLGIFYMYDNRLDEANRQFQIAEELATRRGIVLDLPFQETP